MPEAPMRVLHRPPSAGSRYLPEGPRALARNRLAWITIQAGAEATRGELHVLNVQRNENRTWRLPGRPGFVFGTDRDGVYLLGIERQIGLFDTSTQRFSPLVDGIDHGVDGTIVNDAALCSHGLIFGTKDTAFAERKAGLWFLRRSDLRLFALRRDQLCSNGKVVRPLADGRLELFDIDSPTRTVVRYELDPTTGLATDPTVVIDLRDRRAVPDGMAAIPGTIHEVAVAMFDPEPASAGSVLRCNLATGAVLGAWTTPGAAQVTCPQFVDGPQSTLLVATTAAERLDRARLAEQPNAGCLFAIEVAAPAPTPSPLWKT
ncbi:MAG: hypothetical protein RL398_316 [Planctomycetota bacterium]|jgi:sugar lactone lactonase YvrE